MLYIIIGIAGLALLLYLLTVHRSPATTTFAVVVAIIVAGLIFDPEDNNDKYNDSREFEFEADQILDWTESNPFGQV